MLFFGDDWAEDHHDVYLMNETAMGLGAVCPSFEFGYTIKDLEGSGAAGGTVGAD